MSKIKNGGLDRYGAEPFEQQWFEQLMLKELSELFVRGRGFHVLSVL